MTTPQDPWPKYVTLDSAIKISRRTAQRLGLHGKPVALWTEREKIAAAFLEWCLEDLDSAAV